jgi:hypothetical protein
VSLAEGLPSLVLVLLVMVLQPKVHFAVAPSILFLVHRFRQSNISHPDDLIDHCHQWLTHWQDYSVVPLVAFHL